MSVPGSSVTTQLTGASSAKDSAASGFYRVPVYLLCTLLAIVTNHHNGKEFAFDSLNYHFYVAFSALHDRFTQDYFAAGFRSYFNPYAYVPFYALVTSGLSALQVASLLAAVHSAILWLTYELAICAYPAGTRKARVAVGLCAVGLAYFNPILIQQIGSSFSDITTAELVLAGWLLLAKAVQTPSRPMVLWAGLLCGIATGLKLTNAVHAVAAFAVVAMVPITIKGRIRLAAEYGIALALGGAAVTLPWGFRLWREFGNPLFPFLNGIFRSPYFTTSRLFDYRFVPANLWEALLRPIQMLEPMAMVHEELRAPDCRYAALLLLLILAAIYWLWSRMKGASRPVRDAASDSARVLTAISIGFAIDWAAWLTESGNSRYFLPMGCVAAVMIVVLAFRIFHRHQKARNYLLIGIFALQGFGLWMGASFRWTPARWGGPWFNVEVPKKLATEPNLYLTIGAQSNSFVVPFLAKGSGFVNFTGNYALGLDGPNGVRIQQLIQRYAPHLRMLVRGKELYADKHYAPNQEGTNQLLSRFGLRADMNDCMDIQIHGLYHPLEITFSNVKPVDEGAPDTTYLVSCRLIPDEHVLSAEEVKERRDADVVLDRL